MANEPESLVLELFRGIRADVAETKGELKGDIAGLRAELKGDIQSLRADVASDFVTLNAKIDAENKATREQIVGLRRAVVEYHSVVVGHGMLISELEALPRRIEQHLNLPPMDAH
jgi:hypothetical protein